MKRIAYFAPVALIAVVFMAAVAVAAPYHPKIVEKLRAEGKPVPECPSAVGHLWADITSRDHAGQSSGFFAPNKIFSPAVTDTIKMVVIFAQFQEDNLETTTGKGQFQLDGQGDTDEVRDSAARMLSRAAAYYRAVSYGHFQFDSTLLGMDTELVTVSKTVDRYADSQGTQQDFVKEVLLRADPFVEYGKYDLVVILHAGSSTQLRSDSALSTQLFDDLGDSYTDTETQDTVKLVFISPIFEGPTPISPTDSVSLMGTLCHELGHALGLPDLYDPTYAGNGIGSWGLMGAGNYLGDPQGDSPAWMDPWCREYLGWADTVVETSTVNVTMSRVEDYSTIYKIRAASGYDTDYFLFEYRNPSVHGIDTAPGSGLLIWHIDNSAGSLTSNTVNAPSISGAGHLRVSLVEADGSDVNATSGSSATGATGGQPWPGLTNNTSLANNTTPNSKPYSGADALFSVINIREEGNYLYFTADFNDIDFTEATLSTSSNYWFMFSLPFPAESLDLSAADFIAFLTDINSSITSSNTWISHWDPNIADEDESAIHRKYTRLSTSSDKFTNGFGYWLKLPASIAADLEAAADSGALDDVPDTAFTTPVEIPLYTGWNQIGSPFDITISCTDYVYFETSEACISLTYYQAISEGLLRDGEFYAYVPGYGYIHGPSLSGATITYPDFEPFLGLWVYAAEECTMFIPPYASTHDIDSAFGITAAPRLLRAAPKFLDAPLNSAKKWDDWALQLQVQNSRGITDAQTYVGVKPAAASVYKAPSTPDGIWAGLVSGKNDYSALYKTTDDLLVWTFKTASSDAGPVTLNIHNIGSVPANVPLTLTDLTTGGAVDLRQSSSYTYSARPGEFRSFQLAAGNAGSLSGIAYPQACLIQRIVGSGRPQWFNVLRDWRDLLLDSSLGRGLVKLYYGASK